MDKKTVVVIDGGGRGVVLVDKYSQSKFVSKIIAIPGNDLMSINTSKKVTTYPNLKTTSIEEIIKICVKEKADLIDVAQDNAVEVGLVDRLEVLGFQVVGPTRLAGQIEWDKTWSRNFMKIYKIPSPMFEAFDSESLGMEFIKRQKNSRWFVKASGLAEGKGAIPAETTNEVIAAIKQMQKFGKAGENYLLEEWLVGEEFSSFALIDGKNFQLVGNAQDHKRVNNGDNGENTGGMGCVSNPAVVTPNINKQIKSIFKKAIQGLIKEGRPYKGVLYLGGMVVDKKVYVIEFNARWGDPEAQVILPSIRNDLYQIGIAIAKGDINKIKIKTDNKSRIAIAAVSYGYPINYSNVYGKQIFGLEKINKNIIVYGAGVKRDGKKYLAFGGRLFYIVAEGKNIIEAREKVYGAISNIFIEGNNLHYRTDIGWRDVERLI